MSSQCPVEPRPKIYLPRGSRENNGRSFNCWVFVIGVLTAALFQNGSAFLPEAAHLQKYHHPTEPVGQPSSQSARNTQGSPAPVPASVSVPVLDREPPRPTYMPTTSHPPSFGALVVTELPFTFYFPGSFLWNDSYLVVIRTVAAAFLENYQVLPDHELEVIRRNAENDRQLETEDVLPVEVIFVFTFTESSLEEAGIEREQLWYLLVSILDENKNVIISSLAEASGIDLQNDIVLVFVGTVFAPTFSPRPTYFPTYSPTTEEFRERQQRQLRTRSWLFMTFFWLIVFLCFALENDLLSCICFCSRRRKRRA